jgi:hypothetical protein
MCVCLLHTSKPGSRIVSVNSKIKVIITAPMQARVCVCVHVCIIIQAKQTNSVAFSPQASYTD